MIPLSIWTPFLAFMLPKSLYLNTTRNVSKFLAYGVLGGLACEILSRNLRDKYYWPIVAGVYKEIIIAEQQ